MTVILVVMVVGMVLINVVLVVRLVVVVMMVIVRVRCCSPVVEVCSLEHH